MASVRRSARSILLQPVQVSDLPDATEVVLTTQGLWLRWGDPEFDEGGPGEETGEMVDCPEELRQILQFLEAARNILSVVLPLDQVLDLPMLDWPYELDKVVMRTPIGIFQTMQLPLSCKDVGLWTVDDLPKIKVTHLPTLLALKKVRKIRAAGPAREWDDRWNDFILHSRSDDKVVYQAFDYTSDFYDRRLRSRASAPSEAIYLRSVRGYLKGTPWSNRDEFSVQFAKDLDDNIKYLTETPNVWRPGLYDAVCKEGRERDPNFVIAPRLRSMETLIEDTRHSMPGS